MPEAGLKIQNSKFKIQGMGGLARTDILSLA
jgi:hypothetical protein